MMRRRVLPALFVILLAGAAMGLPATSAKAEPTYSIEGFEPGERAETGRDFQCARAEQQADFTWCQRSRHEKSRRGTFKSTMSILRNQDDVAVYVDRRIEPAFFGSNDIQNEIARLGKRFDEHAHEIRLPKRDELPDAVIATWGKIRLEPLDAEALAALKSGKVSSQNLFVDYLGDLKRSAELGLPVYRILGEAGYLWSASSANGRGHLRFLSIDPSALTVKPAPVLTAKPAPVVAARPATAVAAKPSPAAAAKLEPAAAANEPLALKDTASAIARPQPKKIAAAHPAAALAAAPEAQPIPRPFTAVAANTTIRAKSRPEYVVPTRPASEIDRAFLAAERLAPQADDDLHTGSIQVEAAKASPPASHRMESIVAIIGASAILLFFLASLIERLLREPTGLELLEMQHKRELELEQWELGVAPVTAPRPVAWLSDLALGVQVLAEIVGDVLRRFDIRHVLSPSRVTETLRTLAVRMSPPAARS